MSNSIAIHDVKSLAKWDNQALLRAITSRLQSRFGELPKTGVLAGQAVASACYELVGFAKGPMRDLDWFIESDRPSESDNVVSYRRLNVPSDSINFNVGVMSFSDQLDFRALNKNSYSILFSGTLASNQEINVIGCASGVRDQPVSGDMVISGFDLNCVEIAVDLDAECVVWTDAFQDFLYSKTIRVTRCITPAHTVLRLIKKQHDLRFASVDIERELYLLKMARQIGVLLEPEEKGYLPSQLFSEETVQKHWHTLQSLSSHFTIESVEIELALYEADEQKDEVKLAGCSDGEQGLLLDAEKPKYKEVISKKIFYKIMPQGLSVDDLKLCESMIGMFFFSSSLGLEAYQLASGMMFKIMSAKVSGNAEKAYHDFVRLIDNNDRDTVVSRGSVSHFYRRYSILDEGVYERILMVIKWLLCRDKQWASKLVRRDIKNMMKLIFRHPVLFSRCSNADITVLATVADNVRWLEKQKLSFVVGLFESNSQDTSFFAPLDSRMFKVRAKESVERFLSVAKTRKFEPVTNWLPDFKKAISKEDLNITVLCSQSDFLIQGEQERHCVGGYYERCSSYYGVVLAVSHKRTGATATALYSIYYSKDKSFVVSFRLSQFYGKENSNVAPELCGQLDDEINVAVNLNSLPSEFKRLVETRCTPPRRRSLTDSDDVLPF